MLRSSSESSCPCWAATGMNGFHACAGFGGEGLRFGLGARRRGCGMVGGRRWTGLEPSVGEDAEGEEGESEEEDASAAGRTVLGSDAEVREANSPDGGPTRGSGGRGRSSGEPGRRVELVVGG
jgi:hypothetical protein